MVLVAMVLVAMADCQTEPYGRGEGLGGWMGTHPNGEDLSRDLKARQEAGDRKQGQTGSRRKCLPSPPPPALSEVTAKLPGLRAAPILHPVDSGPNKELASKL